MLKRILIIDDDKSNLKLLSFFLRKRGFSILTASSAEEGYDKISTDILPNIILLDLKLPGMNGLKLTSILKHNLLTKNIIIIACTAYENSFNEISAIKAGCDGYIIKPINVLHLSNKLLCITENLHRS